ncbi:MAG: MFS transporter, partial [Candidatus Dormibacteraeota bacterium]|nr:MFS transporter [Candidatus Dormibacteraeota bacterium]
LGVAWYLDRANRARAVGIFTILSGIFSGLSSRTPLEAPLNATRSLGAVGVEAAKIPTYSLVADYYPVNFRGRAFVMLTSFYNIAAVSALVVTGVFEARVGWRFAVLVFSIAIAVSGVLATLFLREPVRGYFERKAFGLSDEEARVEPEPQSFGEAARSTWAVRTLRRIFFADAISNVGLVAYGLFAGIYLSDAYGLDLQARSFILLPGVLTGLLGGLIGGALLDRFSKYAPAQVLRTVSVFGVISVIGIAILAFHPPVWVIVVSSALVAFGNGLGGPATFVIYSQIIPPTVRTLGLQIVGLNAILGSLLLGFFGLVITQYGYQPAFLLMIPFILLGAIIRITAADLFEVDRRNQQAGAAADAEAKQAKAQGRDKLLVSRGVDAGYDGTQVLFGVDFDVEQGEIIALLGTNGAGKSTLLKAISGSQEATGGAIVFDGRDITHMPPHEIAQRGVVYMPGGRGTFPGLTVEENLSLALWMTDNPAEGRDQVRKVYKMFPVLEARKAEKAQTLSGGEQQMLSLSQAFLAKPRLLMIDELSLGLSPQVVGQLLDIVRQINAEGTTIIVVEQSVNVALEIATKAMFMEKGEVKFVGETAELMRRPDILRSVYVKGTGGGGSATLDPAAQARRQEELERSGPALQVIQVTKTFGGITALDAVSLELRQGEILGLIGPNGSGKTTLFDIISGYQPAD